MQTSDIISLLALVISGLVFGVNYIFPKRTIHLSTQQTIINTVADKVGQCNEMWENDNDARPLSPNPDPHFSVVSEVVMALEVIDMQLVIFERNYKDVRQDCDRYHFLLWKQLRTDLRQFLRVTAPQIAGQIGPGTYTDQIARIHRDLDKAFE